MIADVQTHEKVQRSIYHCHRCGVAYDWRRSTSDSLKMTYCGTLCEVSDLGFAIDELLRATSRGRSGDDHVTAEARAVVRLASAA